MDPLPNKILRSGIFSIFINMVNEALKHEWVIILLGGVVTMTAGYRVRVGSFSGWPMQLQQTACFRCADI